MSSSAFASMHDDERPGLDLSMHGEEGYNLEA